MLHTSHKANDVVSKKYAVVSLNRDDLPRSNSFLVLTVIVSPTNCLQVQNSLNVGIKYSQYAPLFLLFNLFA